MTAEEKATRLSELATLEEAQFAVLWSCFSTDAQLDEARKELQRLRDERWEVFTTVAEAEVIENTEASAELTDEAEKQLMEFIHALSYFDPSEISYSGWIVFCSGVAELSTPIEGLTLGQLAALLPRKRGPFVKEAV